MSKTQTISWRRHSLEWTNRWFHLPCSSEDSNCSYKSQSIVETVRIDNSEENLQSLSTFSYQHCQSRSQSHPRCSLCSFCEEDPSCHERFHFAQTAFADRSVKVKCEFALPRKANHFSKCTCRQSGEFALEQHSVFRSIWSMHVKSVSSSLCLQNVLRSDVEADIAQPTEADR